MFLGGSILGCQSEAPPSDSPTDDTQSNQTSETALLSDKERHNLLKIHCYSCHNPQAPSHDVILGPPLVAAKWRYKKSYPERDRFITTMTDFVHNPTKDKALMRGPVKRFGVMQSVTLPKDQIKEIVTYIYDNDLEEPEWFADHFEEEHGRPWKQ